MDEDIIQTVTAFLLTDKTALHLRATKTFKDIYNNVRKAGEEWLITNKQTEAHIPDVYEDIIGLVDITTLTNREYCVVVNPFLDGIQYLGREELRVGEKCFFLQPGELLKEGIQKVNVLADDEALLLHAREQYQENSEKNTIIIHQPGDRW